MGVPVEPSVDIPFWLESIAIVAGGLAGSLRGIRERLAVTGVLALAVALGLGGGIIRDVLLQAGTPVAFLDPWFVPIVLASSIPALFLISVVNRIEWLVFGADALAIGIYSVLGADKALQLSIPPVGSVLIGVLAGTGGSIVADLIVGTPPLLFRPGILLGVASAAGTTTYVIGASATDARAPWFVAGVAIVTIMRIVSAATGWGVGSAAELAERSSRLLARGGGGAELSDPSER